MRTTLIALSILLALTPAARAREPGTADEPTTFLTGIAVLPHGSCLDLDTGAVYMDLHPRPGVAAEIRRAGARGGVEAVIPGTPDPAMMRLARWQSGRPWIRVTTPEGRAAWYQVLREGPDPVVRYLSRFTGTGEPLAAPRPFCVGDEGVIHVRFDPVPGYERYRIERRTDAASPFVTLATVETLDFKGEPVYEDRDVKDGRRYLYRITGITGSGNAGIPSRTEGTTKSRGCFEGVVALRHQSPPIGVDLLLDRVGPDGGDLVLTGTYGGASGASFRGYLGQPVYASRQSLGTKPAPWDGEPGQCFPPGRPFLVPLPGGGVARCRWAPARSGVTVTYTVNPDSARLDAGPVLATERTARGVVISVGSPRGSTVEQVRVEDLRKGRPEATIPVRDGVALDPDAKDGQVLVYRAVGVDRWGRLSPEGVARLNLLPRGVHRGSFAFHYQQGYSIETGAIVPADRADVVFETCAGGISSIRLRAAGGILNLEQIARGHRDLRAKSREEGWVDAWFRSVVSLDPAALRLGDGAGGDSRMCASDVFVLRTRNGGWAKLAIVHRGREGGWTKYLATVRYAYNPHEPVFEEGKADLVLAGIRIDPRELEDKVVSPRDPAAAAARKTLAEIDGRVEAIAAERTKQAGRPVRVAALLDRETASALGARAGLVSSFSFEHETRDDVEITGDDLELLFLRGPGREEARHFFVRSRPDDRSVIWDLGRTSFDEPAVADPARSPGDLFAPVRKGHVYVVHTVDSNTDLWVKLHVLDTDPGRWVLFRWEPIAQLGALSRLIVRKPGGEMRSPVVRLQLRAGAGRGGRAHAEGRADGRVNEVLGSPLSLLGPVDRKEPSRAYAVGGRIPAGKVWVIERLRYRARVDGNGRGEFLVRIGARAVVHLDGRRGGLLLEVSGLPDRKLTGQELPVEGTVTLEGIRVEPGSEGGVYAEIGEQSWCDVVLEGRFVDAEPEAEGREDR